MKRIFTFLFVVALMPSLTGFAQGPATPAGNEQPGAKSYSEYIRLDDLTAGRFDERHVAALRKAAEEGHDVAQAQYGVYLISKEGPRSPEAVTEGVSWLKRIENLDKPELLAGRFMLGLCYARGEGTAQDIKRAGPLLKAASAQGNADMKLAYAVLLLATTDNQTEAKVILEKILSDDSSPAAQAEAKRQLKALTPSATDSVRPFPLLGLWRVTAASTAKGEDLPASEQMEMEFLADGVLLITAISPAKGFTTPVRLRFQYTFLPPDVVTYTFDGKAVERQRFRLADDTLSFEHLDYKIASKLRRIKKTEFTEPAKDIQEFPK